MLPHRAEKLPWSQQSLDDRHSHVHYVDLMATKTKKATKKLSAAAFIRENLLVDTPTDWAVRAGKKAGYTFTEKYVRTVRAAARAKVHGKRKRGNVERAHVAKLRAELRETLAERDATVADLQKGHARATARYNIARETLLSRDATVADLQKELTKQRARYVADEVKISDENSKLRKVLRIIRDLIDIQLGASLSKTSMLALLMGGAALLPAFFLSKGIS